MLSATHSLALDRSPVQRRSRRLAALALCLLAGRALADLPQILDRVPTDAVATLAAPSLGQADKNINALMTSMNGQGMSLAAILQMVGLTKGVAMDKPFAVVLMGGDMQGELPPLLVLAPVGDFKQFADGLGGKEDGGLTTLSVAGDTFFAKPVEGGYAAMSPMKDLLAKYDGAGGKIGAHAAAIGKSGSEVAGAADLFVIFNAEKLASMGTAAQTLMTALSGPLGKIGLGSMLGAKPGDSAILKDATAGVLGVRAGSAGAHFDAAMNYKAGTPAADALKSGGDSKTLLKTLPGDPFLVAFAIDLNGSGKSLAQKLTGSAKDQPSDPAMLAMLSSASAQAAIIYPNPQGLFDGLLSRGVYFYGGADPATVAGTFKSNVEGMNNKMAGAFQYSTSYTPSAATVDGVSVDKWTMKMSAPGQGSPFALVYGPSGGPAGFVTKSKTGAYATTKDDPKLMSKALAAAGGQGTLGEDKSIAQVASMLPANRVAEAYIGAKAVYDVVSPFIKMMGKPLDYTPPETLAPIGVALVLSDGGFRVDAYAPAESMKAIRAITTAMQAPSPNQPGAQPAAGQGAPAPAPAPAEAKKPSF